MKRFFAFLLAATLSLSLIACGSQNPDAPAQKEQPPEEQSCVYAKGKTLTVITDADAGSNSDTLTRKWAELFTKYSGCDAIVVNEPASSGVVALNMMLGNDADGMTVMQQSQSLPLTVAAGTAPFKAEEVAPLFGLTSDSMWLSVAADSKYQSIEELLDDMKANPGLLNGAGNKTKGMVHYWACLLMQNMDVDFNYIPYDSGNDEITAVVAGDAAFMLLSNNRSSAEVAGGTLRALAITGDKHYDVTPDTPTFGELGYDKANSVTVWRGMFCKAGTSDATMDELEAINEQIVADSDWTETITGMGMNISNKSRSEFTDMYYQVVEDGAAAFEWYDNRS